MEILKENFFYNNKFMVFGHRGVPELCRENTKESFNKAIDLEYDAIELDIMATKDKHLIVLHDLRININHHEKKISDLNYHELREKGDINPPLLKDILLSKKLGSDCVEIHTGTFSNLIKSKKNYSKEFLKIKKCSNLGKKIGLEVHAGHGLDYDCTKLLCKIPEINEFNIGHFIIGESIFYGLDKVIRNFKKIIK